MNEVKAFLGQISNIVLLGFFPLDILLHFFIGALLSIFCLKIKLSYRITFIIIMIVAALKELFDYFFVFKTSWHEYAGDYLASMAFVSLLGLVRRYKQKSKDDFIDRTFHN